MRLPGASGYARLGEVHEDVKVVAVHGKKPGDSGYRIVAESPSSSKSGNHVDCRDKSTT